MANKINPGFGELLRHLTNLVDSGTEEAYRAKGFDYRPRYTPVMRVLADRAQTISDITSRVSISQGAVSQTVKLMEDDGLVVRSRGRDGRHTVIALSDIGHALATALKAHWAAIFQAIENLEDEVGIPLRSIFSRTISALEEQGFAERIRKAEAMQAKKQPSKKAEHSTQAQGFFMRGGGDYAQYRPGYPIGLAQALTAVAPKRRLVVDAGCGSGQLSILLAEYFDRVIAMDISPDQLAHAAVHSKVTYRNEAAEMMNLEDGSVDLIVAAQAAHWFHLPRFYREVRRVAAPGAILALISYGVPCLDGAVNARLQQLYWRELAAWWAPERRHVENGYAELPFPFEELPPPELAIHQDWDLNQMLGYLNTWSAVNSAKAESQEPLLNKFREEFAALWGAPDAKRRITWPIAIRLGRIRSA